MVACADSNVQRKVSHSGYDITPLTQAQRDELAAKVDATTRHIALESGTERAFTGKTVNGALPWWCISCENLCGRVTHSLQAAAQALAPCIKQDEAAMSA